MSRRKKRLFNSVVCARSPEYRGAHRMVSSGRRLARVYFSGIQIPEVGNERRPARLQVEPLGSVSGISPYETDRVS